MKLLNLTGIIVLLSQATSISTAILFPRSSSGSLKLADPMEDIKAAIRQLNQTGAERKSPNKFVQDRAKKFGYKYLIPIGAHNEWNKNC
ncbi:putative secreted effector protein [Blumeria graminis f. sp. tritici 96224]|uniref:Putative secreted effector protein n=1 Tax=Blumeria graminis f. sp. tritici 96224 TaxID=1268274 RepID=A0A656KP92_BLUGR|nr:putative secreted effector protein [Blumeria graminis f. sp. tritici 96224]